MDIVSCPTCARTKINLIPLVKKFEQAVKDAGLEDVPVKVALMGCVVNGPGEAREADVGIAGGIGEAVLFRRGEIVEKIKEDDIIERLLREIRAIKDR
jgi:(E)-4-hydroxy-3-methylbut-2-enyl-diphosphate synthase